LRADKVVDRNLPLSCPCSSPGRLPAQQGAGTPWGTQIRPSCCSGVFVDESAESVASVDLDGWLRTVEARAPPWYRCCQLERSVGPVSVVVVDVDAQDAFKLSSPCDQEPVEAVATDGADLAFGERVRVRRPKRGADDLDTLAAEDVVEGAAEFGVAVVDQETDRSRSFGE
jgi:hypothetical protein